MEVPRNASSYFLFGVLVVLFSGFWTGGAHRQTQERSEDLAALAQSRKFADASVSSCYRGENNTWSVTYEFRVADGHVFAGTANLPNPRAEGTPVKIEYAASDPTVSRVPPEPLPSATPIEWAGVVLGFLILFLIGKFGMDQVGAASGVRNAFAIVGTVAYAAGLVWGLASERTRYTVQVGDRAWTEVSFTDTSRYMGLEMHLQNGKLEVQGREYGTVPNHAHIMISADGVMVTPPAKSRSGNGR